MRLKNTVFQAFETVSHWRNCVSIGHTGAVYHPMKKAPSIAHGRHHATLVPAGSALWPL
jgi:hypothetical protein